MPNQLATADQIIVVVRDVADYFAEALHLDSFADAVVDVLGPLCEDIALAYNSHEVLK